MIVIYIIVLQFTIGSYWLMLIHREQLRWAFDAEAASKGWMRSDEFSRYIREEL